VDWGFWVKWYDSVLDGKPLNGDMLVEIAEIKDEDWEKGEGVVNKLIQGITDKYKTSGLAKTSIADFDFDAALRWMVMVAFKDDTAHLRDPKIVQAFVDDVEELQDGLQDFADFALDAREGNNAPAMLARSAEKVLDELKRVKDKQHIRARRIVTLGGYLRGFSLEESKRAELGDTLAEMLDINVELLQGLCRKHFGPSLARLAPLEKLTLSEGDDPKAILADMKRALEKINQADGSELARLDPEGQAILQDMLAELSEIEAAIAESSTDEHREIIKKRFAKFVGGMSSTMGHYIESAKKHADKPAKWVDQLIKNFKRWEKLSDILEWLEKFGGGGGPVG
jgi:ribosomal protein L13E